MLKPDMILSATTIPNEDNVKYYAQRAGPGRSGLILSEGTLIAHQGTEWENAPGIWDEEHAKGWKKVTDAVHEKGGLIVAQLWHTGRVCHPDMIEQKRSGDPVWAPSDVGARGGKVCGSSAQCTMKTNYLTSSEHFPVSRDTFPTPPLFLTQHTSSISTLKPPRWPNSPDSMASNFIQLMAI